MPLSPLAMSLRAPLPTAPPTLSFPAAHGMSLQQPVGSIYNLLHICQFSERQVELQVALQEYRAIHFVITTRTPHHLF